MRKAVHRFALAAIFIGLSMGKGIAASTYKIGPQIWTDLGTSQVECSPLPSIGDETQMLFSYADTTPGPSEPGISIVAKPYRKFFFLPAAPTNHTWVRSAKLLAGFPIVCQPMGGASPDEE